MFHSYNFISNANASTYLPNAGFTSFMASIEIPEHERYDVPDNDGFKSYMSYKLFAKKSEQASLQKLCITDADGFRRVNDYYVIALGSHFNADIGQRVDLVLQNDCVIQCVLGDVKEDRHTDDSNIFTKDNGCMSEFLVDTKKLDPTVKKHGNVSRLSSQNWDSPVSSVWVYNDNVLNI